MSPLRQYEAAKERADALTYLVAQEAPGSPAWASLLRERVSAVLALRAARTRLTLSAIGYILTALLIVLVLWAGIVGFVALVDAASGIIEPPAPAPDYQLPTI